MYYKDYNPHKTVNNDYIQRRRGTEEELSLDLH